MGGCGCAEPDGLLEQLSRLREASVKLRRVRWTEGKLTPGVTRLHGQTGGPVLGLGQEKVMSGVRSGCRISASGVRGPPLVSARLVVRAVWCPGLWLLGSRQRLEQSANGDSMILCGMGCNQEGQEYTGEQASWAHDEGFTAELMWEGVTEESQGTLSV